MNLLLFFSVLLLAISLLSKATAECPDDRPEVFCMVAPCDNPRPDGCPSDAKCENDYCGGCHARYFDTNGNEICKNTRESCFKSGLNGECPNGCKWVEAKKPCSDDSYRWCASEKDPCFNNLAPEMQCGIHPSKEFRITNRCLPPTFIRGEDRDCDCNTDCKLVECPERCSLSKLDDHSCPTCECCPEIKCDVACPGEFAMEEGCPVCRCKEYKSCIYEDKEYEHGSEFRAADDCNVCFCHNGTVKCTEKACNGDDRPCGDRGVTRDSGDEWTAPDGCNKCHCENGVVSCTEIDCEVERNCREEVESGPCTENILRWFYNARTQQCERFFWGGCSPNGNNYKTKEACERRCPTRSCDGNKEVGPCDASIERYFFNREAKECQKFEWGGCERTANNYITVEECRSQCSRDTTPCPLCPDLDCAESRRIKPCDTDTCACPQCRKCVPTTDRHTCDSCDRLVCRRGFKGDNCDPTDAAIDLRKLKARIRALDDETRFDLLRRIWQAAFGDDTIFPLRNMYLEDLTERDDDPERTVEIHLTKEEGEDIDLDASLVQLSTGLESDPSAVVDGGDPASPSKAPKIVYSITLLLVAICFMIVV